MRVFRDSQGEVWAHLFDFGPAKEDVWPKTGHAELWRRIVEGSVLEELGGTFVFRPENRSANVYLDEGDDGDLFLQNLEWPRHNGALRCPGALRWFFEAAGARVDDSHWSARFKKKIVVSVLSADPVPPTSSLLPPEEAELFALLGQRPPYVWGDAAFVRWLSERPGGIETGSAVRAATRRTGRRLRRSS